MYYSHDGRRELLTHNLLADGINPGSSVTAEWNIELSRYLQHIRRSREKSRGLTSSRLTSQNRESGDFSSVRGTLFDYGKQEEDPFARARSTVSPLKRPYERETSPRPTKRGKVEELLMEKLGSQSGDVQKKLAMGMLKFISDSLGEDALESESNRGRKDALSRYDGELRSSRRFSEDRDREPRNERAEYARFDDFGEPREFERPLINRATQQFNTTVSKRSFSSRKYTDPSMDHLGQMPDDQMDIRSYDLRGYNGPAPSRGQNSTQHQPQKSFAARKEIDYSPNSNQRDRHRQFEEPPPRPLMEFGGDFPVGHHSHGPLIEPAPSHQSERVVQLQYRQAETSPVSRPSKPLLSRPPGPLASVSPRDPPNTQPVFHHRALTEKRANAPIIPRPKHLASGASMLPRYDLTNLLSCFDKVDDPITADSVPESKGKSNKAYGTYILMTKESAGYNYTRVRASDSSVVNHPAERLPPGHSRYQYFSPNEFEDGKLPSVEFIAAEVWEPGHEKVAPMTKLQKEVAAFNLMLYSLRHRRSVIMKKLMNKKDTSCFVSSAKPVLTPKAPSRQTRREHFIRGTVSADKPATTSLTCGDDERKDAEQIVTKAKAEAAEAIKVGEDSTAASLIKTESGEAEVSDSAAQKHEGDAAAECDDWEDLEEEQEHPPITKKEQEYPPITEEEQEYPPITAAEGRPDADTTGDSAMRDAFLQGQDDFIVMSEEVTDETGNEEREEVKDEPSTSDGIRTDGDGEAGSADHPIVDSDKTVDESLNRYKELCETQAPA